ncbi:MAG: GNAT family N-acetyltransferase [Candidatus Zixiibacteriota bacterium]
MSLKEFSSDNLPRDEWSRLTGNCIYVSPEFASVWRTAGGREIFLVLESDGVMQAGIAGVIFGKKFLRRCQSMPDGLPGGVFFSSECGEEQRLEFCRLFESWLKSNRFLRADINKPSFETGLNFFDRHEGETHIIDLSHETYVPPRREVRKQIRAAKRREARVTMLNDEKYLKRFYELVIETEHRHNQEPRYSPEFFSRLLKISMHDDRILWFIALVDEKIIGYHICFVDKTQLMTWQFYSDKHFTRLKPGYLLLDYIINYALEHNIKSVNMGSSPPDAESLVDFKERWGGRKKTFSYYTYFSTIGRLLYRWRSR